MSDAPDRKARLAAALRANLRRRKAGADGSPAGPKPPELPDEQSPPRSTNRAER